MQTKEADFSKLPTLLKVTVESLKSLKEENSDWLSHVKSTISMLRSDYSITIMGHQEAMHISLMCLCIVPLLLYLVCTPKEH